MRRMLRHEQRGEGRHMAIEGVLAQAVVTDLDRAVEWYTTVFGKAPDDRPMDGLVEWHFGPSCGVQVWLEPERAGRSSMVLDDGDLDAMARRLKADGVTHGDIEQVTSSRILRLADPDGNRIVIAGQ